jgi:hypothetical protein
MEMRPRYRGRSDSAEEVIYYPRSKKLHGTPSDERLGDRNYHGDGEIRDVVEEVRHELLRETSPQSRQTFQFASNEDIMEAGTTSLMGSSLGSSMMDGASTYGASTSLLDSYGNGSISLLDGEGSTSMMDGGGSLSLLDGESGITLLEKNAPRNAPRKVPEYGPRMRDFRETKQPPMRDFRSKKPPVRKSKGFDENSITETTVAETTTVGLTTVGTYESEDNVSDFDSSCFISGFDEIAQDAQQLFCCGPHLEQVSNTSNSVVETAATELIHESILNQADSFFTDEQARTIGKTFSQVSLEFDDAGNRVVDMTTRIATRNMCAKENVDPAPVRSVVTEPSTVPEEVTFRVRVISKLNKKKSTKKSKKHSFLVKRKTSTKVEEQGAKKGMFGKLRRRFRKGQGRQQ